MKPAGSVAKHIKIIIIKIKILNYLAVIGAAKTQCSICILLT
ncbi:hypothetical protein HMPREF0758_1646 [Serratia odorifera DSM 4582]|uniref:Uncharacterized protein n=1 Tax=Serratia odorifera DSM 4582 TaxID=667129 RepID=D4E0E6_SEROD|nr:hypothetical protein HMPREF0758_1646 [Serratia odorifera DSM 4582]